MFRIFRPEFLAKQDTFWYVAVSDFRPLEIYKNLGLSLSTITFTVKKSHADNHFYKYIYLFQISFNISQYFYLKYMLRFVIFKFGLNVKHCSDVFQ